MKTNFVLLLLLTLVQSCQYRPFVKYYFPSKKTHVARFTKWEKSVGSNSNSLRSCYDVSMYDWTVHVHPEEKTIDGVMKINFRMVSDQDSVLLDLQGHLKIDEIKSSVALKKTKRKKDVLFIVFKQTIRKGESVSLEISYHGSPVKMLSYSAITWGKDTNNKPWICTATEGIGPHHMMPCKNLLSDEPDSCFIRVGVPKELVGVSNGKLERTTETETEKIYHWAVRNPINVYNISFNVGDYVKLEKAYLDIDQVARIIEIYALSYNKELADTFYNQAPVILQKLEQLYGVYPWWNDGCKIVETCLPHGVCMEHQSAISMTDAYQYLYMGINLTLVHELGHEWWGNSVTASDYGDLWLHEGFADYSEVLFLEVFLGKEYYDNAIHYFSKSIVNKRPVIKPYDVRYNCLVHDDDGDIYSKGVLFLHTLRRQLQDDTLFFKVLKTAQQHFSKGNLTSEQFLTFFNEQTNQDFTPFFDLYLKQITPPILEFHFDPSASDSISFTYNWAEYLPVTFTMKLTLNVGGKLMDFYPTAKPQQFKFPKNQHYYLDIAQFGYVLFEERTE